MMNEKTAENQALQPVTSSYFRYKNKEQNNIWYTQKKRIKKTKK